MKKYTIVRFVKKKISMKINFGSTTNFFIQIYQSQLNLKSVKYVLKVERKILISFMQSISEINMDFVTKK